MGTPNQRLVEISRLLRPFLGALSFKELRHYIGEPFLEDVEDTERVFESTPACVTAPLSLSLSDRVRKLSVDRGIEKNGKTITKARHEDLIIKLVKDGGIDLRFYYMISDFSPSNNSADHRLYCTRGVITSISDQGEYPSDRLCEYLAVHFWIQVRRWQSDSVIPRNESLQLLKKLEDLTWDIRRPVF